MLNKNMQPIRSCGYGKDGDLQGPGKGTVAIMKDSSA